MASRIPSAFIQEVLARSDIVEIVRSRVQLKQRGDNHLARCPFHEEKSPSFNVSQSKQFYYCFGCGASGNAIGFLIAYDHMEFREAVAWLASRAGLEIPTTTENEDTPRYQLLHQTMDGAMQYYRAALRNHLPAIDYLKSRKVLGITAKNFNIGYAPGGWEDLQAHFNGQPELQEALTTSGLVIAKEAGRTYDRFRDRIMFPIRNIQGLIIGVGGRSLGEAQPKYLNSPETPVFHKGSELYGLYEARRFTSKLARLIVVEGYMDVVALHQHGITEAVATLGTAVTAKQVQKCLRYVSQLIFCFDGDRAGRNAAWKALTISLPLLREGVHIRFLFLPEKEDPDSLIRKIGPAAFSQLLEKSVPLAEVFFKELKTQSPLNSPADKAQFGRQAAEHLNTMPHGLFRELMYGQLAQELAIDAENLQQLLQSSVVKNPPLTPANETAKPATLPVSNKKPAAGLSGRQLLPPLHLAISLLLQQPALSELFVDAELELLDIPGKKLLSQILHALREQPGQTTGELLASIEDEQEQQLIAQLASRTPALSQEAMKMELLGALSNLEQQSVEQNINQLVEKAKKSQLNLEEKRKLQTLLAKIKRDANER
jgi:DNA primase